MNWICWYGMTPTDHQFLQRRRQSEPSGTIDTLRGDVSTTGSRAIRCTQGGDRVLQYGSTGYPLVGIVLDTAPVGVVGQDLADPLLG